jgi:hypothetical protein
MKKQTLKETIKACVQEVLEEMQFDPIELQMGIKDEMEHTDDPKESEKIAKVHLKKHPNYYSQLKKYGLS